MENPTPDDLNQLLQDFSSVFAGKRLATAMLLGKLPVSNAEIVQALAAAVATDSDPEVRSAAVLALQSPVHQDFIKNNPDLMQQAVESAVRGKTHAQQAEDERITQEFQRLIRREKIAYLAFILSIPAVYGLFILLLVLDVDPKALNVILRIVQITIIAAAGLFIWRSWQKWRCPNCGSWLGGFKAGVNVFWASSPLRCPHCGAKLL
jgi:hypothetical protein